MEMLSHGGRRVAGFGLAGDTQGHRIATTATVQGGGPLPAELLNQTMQSLQAAADQYRPGQWAMNKLTFSPDKTSMTVVADYCGATTTASNTWQIVDSNSGDTINYTAVDQGPSPPGTTCTAPSSGMSSGAVAAVAVLGVGALGVLGWMLLK